jgi:LuxR family transcriptional regulator, maltose regulon positive regulatory protein
MTAPTTQGKTIRRERRIIERPRLMKLLDESEARTILLLAPAGYGKTTLARQWAKTLNGAIWVTATAAHRDVTTLAHDVARGIDLLGGDASKFIKEYLRARSNPQRAARDVAMVLAQYVEEARVQWIVIDDYHELVPSPEADAVIDVLHEHVGAKFLVASRLRPSWATSRRIVYGEIFEVEREQLAMDDAESNLVLGRHKDRRHLIEQSKGWPAVLGLAAGMGDLSPPGSVMPTTLYDYFAAELFRSASAELQQQLVALALLPDFSTEALLGEFKAETNSVIDHAQELGFLSTEQAVELHPLAREFLLQKLSEDPDWEQRVRAAVESAIYMGRWDRAFELILRFKLLDMVELSLEAAYRPLTRAGNLGTLSSFATAVRVAPSFPPPVVDLVEAEVAYRDGAYGLAVDIAARVREQLPANHVLAFRASAIIGQSAYIQADLERAETAFRVAWDTCQDDEDEIEALYGWALASIQGEAGDSGWIMARLADRRTRSPLDLVRHAIAEITRRHFAEGFPGKLPIDEGLHVLDQVEDPRIRSSFAAIGAYISAVQANYQLAFELTQRAEREIDAFSLEFARPHVRWNTALALLGLRKFGAADRALQTVEDIAKHRPLGYHILNARILRARLALQTGETEFASQTVRRPIDEAAIPSIHGEYFATRALVMAVLGEHAEAFTNAEQATLTSSAIEVRVLAQAAKAVCGVADNDSEPARELWKLAAQLGAWDPVVVAARSCRPLSDALAQMDDIRPSLANLYESSNDLALARRAGFRTRTSKSSKDVLSPRELEVLELMARGFRNRDISRALVISESTTKVHVRHILEKLGVRTRTEAVTKFNP